MMNQRIQRAGDVKWGLIALLLGLPLPVVLLAFLFMGGCR
jgi:hypothetical protein